MPTVNPRINVTLSESMDALVARLAKLQRVSKSQVVRELLEAGEPALARAATLMEAAAGAVRGVNDSLRQAMNSTIESAEAEVARQLAGMDAMAADLVSQAQAVRGRRPRRLQASSAGEAAPRPEASGRGMPQPASKGGDPLPSNRGVKTAKRAKKAASQGSRS